MNVCKNLIFGFVFSLLIGGGGFAFAQKPAHENRNQPVSAQDVEILDKAAALLSKESDWNRKDTRKCPADATTLSLFCALQKASVQVLGEYNHRRVALQEVRFSIEDVSGGRKFSHRLMDFNNLPETSFADVKQVLALARVKVLARLKAKGH